MNPSNVQWTHDGGQDIEGLQGKSQWVFGDHSLAPAPTLALTLPKEFLLSLREGKGRGKGKGKNSSL